MDEEFELIDPGKELKIIEEIRSVFNKYSFDNYANTPDFILAEIAYFAALHFARGVYQDRKLRSNGKAAKTENQ